MKREDRAVLNEIIDEHLALEPDSAAGWTIDSLRSLEAGGIQWAADYLESCLWSGVRSRVTNRARSGRLAVDGQSIPTCYVTGGAMTSWMHAPVDELDPVVERLDEQAETLNNHARIIERGQKAARAHGVPTAWLGFEAAGIVVAVAS